MNGNSQKKKPNCWSRRTKLEIFLAITLIIIAAHTFWYTYTNLTVLENANTACTHFECLKASVEIESSLNVEIDPCQDFNGFVCGGNPINIHTTEQIGQIMTEVTSFIESPITTADSQHIQIQKKFYKACLDIDQIDKDTNFDLLSGYFDELGGWPVAKGPNWLLDTDFNWIETVYKCQQLGLPSDWFLEFGIQHSEEMNRFEIAIPNCNQFKLMDLSVMVDVAVTLSASKLSAISQMNAVVQFEKQLANICEKERERAETIALSISELEEMFPKYNWLEIVMNITAEINETSEVVTNIRNYIEELDHLLIKTPKRIQANFIIWQIITVLAPFTPHSIRHFFEDTNNRPNRNDFCLQTTHSKFYYLSEWEYITKYTTPSVHKAVTEMTELIRKTFINRIENANWIPNDVKNTTIDNLNTLICDIGGQPDILSDSFNKNFVFLSEQFNFTSTNPIEMFTEFEKNRLLTKFELIDQNGLNKENFDLYPLNIRPEIQYIIGKNRLIVPAPLLHGYSFNIARPMYLNYATLGSLIATELAQILLDNETSTDSIIHCYLQTNKDAGILIRDKNIVLNEFFLSVGRDLAYLAYQKFIEKQQQPEFELMNLFYNSNQLFWIQSSLSHCKNDANNGALINSYYFGNDWQCSRGDSVMHPLNKCWVF